MSDRKICKLPNGKSLYFYWDSADTKELILATPALVGVPICIYIMFKFDVDWLMHVAMGLALISGVGILTVRR